MEADTPTKVRRAKGVKTSPPRPRGGHPKMYPAFNKPSNKHGNPVSRIVGTSGKRLTISLTNNWLMTQVVLTYSSTVYNSIRVNDCGHDRVRWAALDDNRRGKKMLSSSRDKIEGTYVP